MTSLDLKESLAHYIAKMGWGYSDVADVRVPPWVPPVPAALINTDVVFEGHSLRALLEIEPAVSLEAALGEFGALFTKFEAKGQCPPPKSWIGYVVRITNLRREDVIRFINPVRVNEALPNGGYSDYREVFRYFVGQVVALLAFTYPGGLLLDEPYTFSYVSPGGCEFGVVKRRIVWPGFSEAKRGWGSSSKGARPYYHASVHADVSMSPAAAQVWEALGVKAGLPQDHPARLALLVLAYTRPRTFRRNGMWVRIAQIRGIKHNLEMAKQWRDIVPAKQYTWLLSCLCPAVMSKADFVETFPVVKNKNDVEARVAVESQWDEALEALSS